MVLQVAVLLHAQERAEKAAAQWQDGSSLVWNSRRGDGSQVAVGAARFADAAAAHAYFGLTLDLQRKQDDLLNTAPGSLQRVKRSEAHSATLAGADEAVEMRKEFDAGAVGGSGQTVATLLARSGNLVVQFSWRECAPRPQWAADVLAALNDPRRRP
jgi:hypothetical protein